MDFFSPPQSLKEILVWSADLILYVLGVAAAVHALIRKRDPRSALCWVVVCLGFKGFGPMLYLLLGVNRIENRARDPGWQARWNLKMAPFNVSSAQSRQELEGHEILRLTHAITRRPLTRGNTVKPLIDGEEAYPRMLETIAKANQSVFLSTFIFDNSPIGLKFAKALGDAARRGVKVYVLVDGIGCHYSFPTICGALKREGVRHEKFLSLSRHGIHLNLRNHRKILVVDGAHGFTGGMNIGDRHLTANEKKKRRVCDIHFEVTGPVAGQLQSVFLEDWHFVTGEKIAETLPALVDDSGSAYCRGITAGPNERHHKLHWIVGGVFSHARRSVKLMTPYFLPDPILVAAINTAKLRGVDVEIILPACNNIPLIHWASRAQLWQLLQYGVKIYYQPGTFTHTKYIVMDGEFTLMGSANIDPRSLRLNFEFNMEVHDQGLAGRLDAHFEKVKKISHEITLQEMDARPLPTKIRDGTARLFMPYL